MKSKLLGYLFAVTFLIFGSNSTLNCNLFIFSEASLQTNLSKESEGSSSAVDSVENDLTVCIIPQNSSEIVSIDIKSGAEVFSIPLLITKEVTETDTFKILSISGDGKSAYIINEDRYIQRVDFVTKEIEQVICLNSALNGFTLSTDGKKAYICYQEAYGIDYLDLIQNQLVHFADLEKIPHCMALDPIKNNLYVSCRDSNEIISIDLDSSEACPFLSLDDYIDALTISKDGHKIFAFQNEGHRLVTIAIETKSVEYFPAIEYRSRTLETRVQKIGLDSTETYAYLAKEGTDEIIPINLKSHKIEPLLHLNRSIASIDFFSHQEPIVDTSCDSEEILSARILPTMTFLSSEPNPSMFGNPVTLTVAVAGESGTPTGTVTFMDGSTTLGTFSLDSGATTLTTSSLSAGSHSLTAVYNGDAIYDSSTSDIVIQHVNQLNVDLSSFPNPSTVGELVLLYVDLDWEGSGTPTGTVTFMDGSTTLGTSSVRSAGYATWEVSSLSLGSHSLTAVYNGDVNYDSSTSNKVCQQVNKINTSTSLTSNPNPSRIGETITLTATVLDVKGVEISGTVTFMDGSTTLGTSSLDPPGYATLNVYSLSAGSHSLTAVYNGDVNYDSSTSNKVFQHVNQLNVDLSSFPNPSTVGNPVHLRALLDWEGSGTPTGTVTFMDGSTTLGTSSLYPLGYANLDVFSLSVGSHSLTAVYNGDVNYDSSTSNKVFQQVNKINTSTSLTSNPNSSRVGETITLTATVLGFNLHVGPIRGTVAFMDGSTTLGTSFIDSSGTAILTTSSLSVGSHSLTAVYNGDVNYDSSTSIPVTQEVIAKKASITTLTSDVNPSTVGNPVTLTATVTGESGIPTGTVAFMDGSTILGTSFIDSSGTAILTTSSLSVGSHSLTAVYGGDANYDSSTSDIVIQQVKINTSTSLTSNPNPSRVGETITLTATVLSVEGGAAETQISGIVTFMDGSAILGTSSLDSSGNAILTTSSLSVGSHSLTAIYNGSNDFILSTSQEVIQVVEADKIATTTTISSSLNPATLGSSITFRAEVSSLTGIPTGEVTFSDGSVILGTATLNRGVAHLTVSNLSLGDHRIIAFYNGNTNFTSSTSEPFTQTVISSTTPQKPRNFHGRQVINKFINYNEMVNVLHWNFPENGAGIVAFEVYRNPELTQLVGRVSSNTRPLILKDGNREKHQTYTYYLVSVNASGLKSPVVSTTVKPHK